MMIRDNKITFASGKVVQADGNKVAISERGQVIVWQGKKEVKLDLTDDEKVQLANHMVYLWSSINPAVVGETVAWIRGTDGQA